MLELDQVGKMQSEPNKKVFQSGLQFKLSFAFQHPRSCAKLIYKNFFHLMQQRCSQSNSGYKLITKAKFVTNNLLLGMEKLAFRPEGYNFWTWKGHKIHYVEQGQGLPIVLIHGFGASAFHWRYNIPELAKKYKVYALDLLGFGWSEKAIIDYDATIWRDQVTDFMKDIVKEPAIFVGNSLGGFTALFAAAELPQLVRGLVLLNTAGQFGNSNMKPAINDEQSVINKYIVNPFKQAFQRVILGFLFWQSKQPARVESVLKSVYIDTSNVDDYLVESIIRPAGDPNAREVYYRLMTRFIMNQSQYTLDSILQKLSCPLLLLWGDLDPWVGPSKAVRIKEFYPNTTIVNLKAGHCPHDEVPEVVNKALIDWLTSLDNEASLQMAQT